MPQNRPSTPDESHMLCIFLPMPNFKSTSVELYAQFRLLKTMAVSPICDHVTRLSEAWRLEDFL